jgi:lactate dehydrogenase-like 2-hydroxyacid dehydrogenase
MTATSTGLIYVSRLLTDRAMAHLHSLGAPVRVGGEAPPTRAELQAGIAGAGAAVLTLTEHVDADVLAAAGPQLKVIANVAVGFDNIDLDAAAAAGVTITNTPGVLDRATADHTFALILAATRRITEGDRLIRTRQPWVWGPRMLVGLDISAGATLGILGYGRIGEAVARRAQAFDMTVVATSLDREAGTVENGVTFVDTPTLLADSDVVTTPKLTT